MPDWKRLVRKRMRSALNLPPEVIDEVAAELTTHLEDVYERARVAGAPRRAAIRLALQEVESWSDLTTQIRNTRSTEDVMTHRTRTLWLPGIAVLFVAGLALVIVDRAPALQELIWIALFGMLFGAIVSEARNLNERTKRLWLPGFASMTAASLFLFAADLISDPSRFFTQLSLRPQAILRGEAGPGLVFYFSWVIAHLLFGGLAAFLSRQAGGSRGTRVLAGMFPAVAMFFLCGIVIPISAFAQHNLFVERHPMTLVFGIMIWAGIPGIALLAGATPFLSDIRPENGPVTVQ